MTDDICGAITGAGEECKNPAGENGRCWIPSHQPDADEDTENPQGRPYSLGEDDHEDILEAARMGKSKRGCARSAGVDKDCLTRYLENHSEFRAAFTRARAQGESELIDGGLRDPDVDSSFAKFMLASSFEYKKTEAREHEHSGDVDGFNVVINPSSDEE